MINGNMEGKLKTYQRKQKTKCKQNAENQHIGHLSTPANMLLLMQALQKGKCMHGNATGSVGSCKQMKQFLGNPSSIIEGSTICHPSASCADGEMLAAFGAASFGAVALGSGQAAFGSGALAFGSLAGAIGSAAVAFGSGAAAWSSLCWRRWWIQWWRNWWGCIWRLSLAHHTCNGSFASTFGHWLCNRLR